MSQSERDSAEIHRHSGWLVPLVILLAILVLSALFLLYYLRPGANLFRDNGPTAVSTSVAFSVRGVSFRVPANYLESRGARGGGDQDVVALLALLPENVGGGMRGYSAADAGLVSGNAAGSRRCCIC